jgi:hypothetical protein
LGQSIQFARGQAPADLRWNLLARDSGGVLWQYTGAGNATAPFKPRVRIGAGWQIYNALI